MKPPEPTTGEGSCRIAERKCKASAAIAVLQRKARNLLSRCWQPYACVSAHARVSVHVCVHYVWLEVEERSRFPEWRDGEVQGPEPQHSCPLHRLRNPHRHSLRTGLRRGVQRNQMVCVNQMVKCKRNQIVIALSLLLLDNFYQHQHAVISLILKENPVCLRLTS